MPQVASWYRGNKGPRTPFVRIRARLPLRSVRVDAFRHILAGLWYNASAVRVRGVFSAGTRRPTRMASAVDVKLRRFAKWPSLPLRLMLRARQPRLPDTGFFWLRLRRSWSGAGHGRGVHIPRTPHDRMCLWVFSQAMPTLYSTSMRKANANPCAAACHGVWGAAPASNSNPSPRQRPSLVG